MREHNQNNQPGGKPSCHQVRAGEKQIKQFVLRVHPRIVIASVMLLLLLFGSLPMPVLGQNAQDTVTLSVVAGPDIRFTALTGEEGLPSGNVYGIAQDERGFLWFATGDGLSRYDGYSFRTYRFERGNPNSLATNTVQAILLGRGGVLWLGTSGGGLDRFDPATETFTHYRHDPNDPNSLSGNAIPQHGLYEDRQGVLGVGTTDGGLNRLDPAAGTFTHYRHDPQDANSLSSNSIESIYQDAGGMLWIGTIDAGLNRLDPVSGRITRYVPNPDDPHALPGVYVHGVYEDRAGTFWVAATPNGFGTLDRQTGRFTRYAIAPDDPDAARLNSIVQFHEDVAGNLWLAANGAGVLRFDRQRQQVVQYKNDPANPHSLRNNFISSFLEEPSGTLWVATLGGGANGFSTRLPKFAHYKHEADNPNSVADNFIFSIFEDQTGIVWIGTSRTLNRWDRRSNTWQVYRNDPNDPDSITTGSVTATQEDPDGTLWFGTYRGGLNRFDPKTGQFKAYRFDPNDPLSLSDEIVRSLYRDSNGVLWVGGWNNGLNRFDRTTETFQRYLPDPGKPDSLGAGSVTDIYEDRAKTLWVATEGGGLNRFDPATETFTRFQNDPQNLKSLPDDAVRVLYEDQVGQFWVGTAGGLCAFDRANGTCTTVYTVKEGLPNNTIEGLLEDKQGNLWISTNNGLARFNPQAKTFRNYDVLDGLQSNEFHVFTAFYKSPRTGEMYFGGINGFNVFDPSQVVDDPFVPPVVLTDFRLFGKPVPVGGDSVLHKTINETDALTLPYNQNSISFEFAALSYVAPAKNQYRYKLEGFDADWRTVGSKERMAVYTNLDAGNYVFRVQGTNEDGVWNEQGVALKITITPPWWGTWWFRGAVIAAILALAFTGYRWRVRSLHQRNLELEHQVTERTHQLAESNHKLQIAKDDAEEAQRAAEVANRAKSVFLANMSHELRTPLNAILGYADILKRHTGHTDSLTDGLDIIEQSGEHLLTLINDVLDLAKIEAGKMDLVPAPFHLPTFLHQIIDIIRARAESKDISLTFEALSPLPVTVLADEKRFRQVLLNLLGNAVKFTDQGHVTLRVMAKDEGGMHNAEGAPEIHHSAFTILHFEVEDTGIGIAPDQLERIFQPFEQVSESARRAEGAGLGLAISQQIVQLMGSRLQVRSEPGRGSTFWFEVTVPVTGIAEREQPTFVREIIGYEGARQKVLVADDKEYNRRLLVDMLKPLGFEVRTVEDGQQAVEEAQAWQPNVILMDLVMPVKTGIEATQEIRQRPALASVLIIAVSASVLDVDEEKSRVAGCDAFLHKPVKMEKLLDLLETHLKLNWLRTEPKEQGETVAVPLIPLPQEELAMLYKLAQSGRILDIQAHADHLARLNEAYLPFCDRLQELAKGFEVEQIVAFVGQFVQEEQNGRPQ
jgi:signal transduction histidine kinase/ligand-binding sensor domain-containing protein/FixJ family two-component response regulator